MPAGQHDLGARRHACQHDAERVDRVEGSQRVGVVDEEHERLLALGEGAREHRCDPAEHITIGGRDLIVE